jgi:hypothetical protein
MCMTLRILITFKKYWDTERAKILLCAKIKTRSASCKNKKKEMKNGDTMLSEKIKQTVLRAVVTVVKQGGQGVLVSNGLILTAAHCVNYTNDGPMALGGEYFIEELQAFNGPLSARPLAVEPVSDIAVLGALDVQEFYYASIAFEEFCENTRPVRICLKDFPLFEPFPVYIYTHTKKWVQGNAQQCSPDANGLSIEMSENIERGTSGSPIVTEKGELVGIASVASSHEVFAPRPHVTLPIWALKRIQGKRNQTKTNLNAERAHKALNQKAK